EVAIPRYHGPLLAKSLIVMAVMVVLFFVGQPVAKVAIVGGAYLLLTRRVKTEKVYIEIDWSLLVLFIGLFVVVFGHTSRWAHHSQSLPLLSACFGSEADRKKA